MYKKVNKRLKKYQFKKTKKSLKPFTVKDFKAFCIFMPG